MAYMVMGNGVNLEDVLRNGASSITIDSVKAVAERNAHDNYSATLIRIE